MTNQDKLRLALQLITSAKSTLDRTAHKCEACHRKVMHNWAEHQVGETLAGVESRIQRLLDQPDLSAWLTS